MSCYYPIPAYTVASGGIVFDEKKRHGDITGKIEVACGQCTGCRLQHVANWQTRIVHEAQMHKANSFITLTYGHGQMPKNASLDHRDYQLFMKRARKKIGKPITYYMCGEYGDETGRPHYHACIFGYDFPRDRERGKSGSGEIMYESDQLTELWGLGHCTTQDLNSGTAAYAAGYIMKKLKGKENADAYNIVTPDGEILERTPPYSRASNKNAIGKSWFEKNGKTDLIHDYVIQDGIKKKIPPYYEKLQKRAGGITIYTENIREEKKQKIDKREQWPDRLKVREEVAKAKIANKLRNNI